jgi:hypothetical protein
LNQSVELDSNGNRLSSVVTSNEVKANLTSLVSQKSLFESLINSSYEIAIDLKQIDLKGIYFRAFILAIYYQMNRLMFN